ncbi:hypothetical protein R1sor_027372 [Riccia sorocarpa]|uniref:Ubiquitin-like protease family profile domain-containing protein n=1 Tax=Riccia sorocarpa TaxID=122646 RepID=A0ABD3GI91_9MARC
MFPASPKQRRRATKKLPISRTQLWISDVQNAPTPTLKQVYANDFPTTEDATQAAIATPEEGQQAKKKKKTADEKDGSMVRDDLKLPPPVPRPFCETDFTTIARLLDAEDVRKEKEPKHKRQAPPMISTLKNFCAMTPRPEAKGFNAYVSKVKILIRQAFAKPMRLPKFGSKIKLTDLPIDGRKPSPVGKKPVLDDDIRPLFDDDEDDEGDNEDSSHPSWLEEHLERENIQHMFMTTQYPQKGFLLPPHIAEYADMLVAVERETMLSTERRVDLGNLVRDGQKIVTTVSNDDKLETFRTVRWITPPIYDWTDVPFLFILVHADTHWSLIVVKLQSRGPFFPYSAIYHLDSDELRLDFKKISGVVARWLKTVLPEGWVIEHAKQVKVLRQINGHDCGIHVMAMTQRLISIADSISLQLELRDLTSLLSTSDIEDLRQRLRRLAMAS